MRVFAAALAGAALFDAAGCGETAESAASIEEVVPSEGYNDVPVDVAIRGGPFRPSYSVDLRSGQTSIARGAFSAFLMPADVVASQSIGALGLVWRSGAELGATLPAALPPGLYDVEVRDPRGHVASLKGGFRSLGPDTSPPTVTITTPAPGAVVAAGTEVPVMLRADDGLGHLASLKWVLLPNDGPPASEACPVDPGASEQDCSSTFLAPTPTGLLEPISIQGEAQDTAGNPATREIAFYVAQRPEVSSLAPTSGPTGGMTELVIVGANFVAGGTQILIDGVPADPGGGVVDSPTAMHGQTPAHDPGVVQVVVRTGSADAQAGTFEYVAPPRVRAIDPPSGPTAGGTPMEIAGDHFRAVTQVFFGSQQAPLLCPVLVSEHLITGFAPPGTGTVMVFASDPVAGGPTSGPSYAYMIPPPTDGGQAAGGDGGATSVTCPPPDGGTP
jgi:hypothetical protein